MKSRHHRLRLVVLLHRLGITIALPAVLENVLRLAARAQLVTLLIKGRDETLIGLLDQFDFCLSLLQNDVLLVGCCRRCSHSQLCLCVLKIAGEFRFEFGLTAARVRLIMKCVFGQHCFASFD